MDFDEIWYQDSLYPVFTNRPSFITEILMVPAGHLVNPCIVDSCKPNKKKQIKIQQLLEYPDVYKDYNYSKTFFMKSN